MPPIQGDIEDAVYNLQSTFRNIVLNKYLKN